MRARLLCAASFIALPLSWAPTSSAHPAQQIELTKLQADDGEPTDRFGNALDVRGDIALVGAQADDDGGFDAGAAYVFERVLTGWVQTQKLLANEPGSFQRFGANVATDGERLVVGEPDVFVGPIGFENFGVGHVFERSGGRWVETAQLSAPALNGVKQIIGGPMAISGATVVFGDEEQDGSGVVYVFEEQDGAWSPPMRLQPSDAAPGDLFGNAVDVRGDTVVVGARAASGAVEHSGAVYVFERRAAGWVETAKLTASAPQPHSSFGASVALDRKRLAIGANHLDSNGFDNRGALYVFAKEASGWREEARLVPADTGGADEFGDSVHLMGSLAIGGSRNHPPGLRYGAAFVFQHSGGRWNEVAKLVSSEPKIGERLGELVRLTASGALVSTSLFDKSTGAVFQYAGTASATSALGYILIQRVFL